MHNIANSPHSISSPVPVPHVEEQDSAFIKTKQASSSLARLA